TPEPARRAPQGHHTPSRQHPRARQAPEDKHPVALRSAHPRSPSCRNDRMPGTTTNGDSATPHGTTPATPHPATPHPRRHTPRRVVGGESAYGTLSTTARQRHAGETSTESANHRVESGNHIMTPPRVHICVVCSGNICRSPMAKVILTEHLRNAGL